MQWVAYGSKLNNDAWHAKCVPRFLADIGLISAIFSTERLPLHALKSRRGSCGSRRSLRDSGHSPTSSDVRKMASRRHVIFI
jgi:hypothetical protein